MSTKKSKSAKRGRPKLGKEARSKGVFVRFTPSQIEALEKKAGDKCLPAFVHESFFPKQDGLRGNGG